MNEVERTEKSNSKLLKGIVIALQDDKELNLKNIIKIINS
ncbi:conjugal transfer protein TraA [Orientia tsutsugamushi]|uniref:Conjugal transfer protein TraA n=1 Tax=Orientia tsutsugamushi TaxID=784 RepID=A0A2U3RD13_ORITS|nr:putative conjugative transfer protein TraA [Orientia tsutsugamushi str. TA763]KJV75356.1 putative conjugative transfer protein TraA [Orientia tsutsugamushi str. TA763]KJV94907.1 putative conjugative transfer protein TraA [Orientia tsutsugamushi str. UT76]SPP25391.1 conjugal transfer protein TraA [Orientia tsutsugamushi]SPR11093.1 conjugal transfer protein TraA [Orientia tsutsugamushi]